MKSIYCARIFLFIFSANVIAPFILIAASKAVNSNGKSIQNNGFIENKGQIIDQKNNPNPAVLYLLNTPGMNVQLRKGGFSYDLYTVSSRRSAVGSPKSAVLSQQSGVMHYDSSIQHPASSIQHPLSPY